MTRTQDRWALPLLAVALLLQLSGCQPAASPPNESSSSPAAAGTASDESAATLANAAPAPLVDEPTAPYRLELLDTAFAVATAIPVDPHIKDRSRAQEAVIGACLELGQGSRAAMFIPRIDNWRRGSAYAELAFYCARNGRADRAMIYVNQAEQTAKAEASQDWRKDRIRVGIARAESWLGRRRDADAIEAGLDPSEAGKVTGTVAMRGGEATFDEEVRSLGALVEAGQFDTIRNVLDAYAGLFGMHYGDAEKRGEVERRMRQAWERMPLFVKIGLLAKLAGSALDHEDRVKATALVDEAQALADTAAWPPRYHVPLMADLAALRFRCGQSERARGEARAAMALFESQQKLIVNIERAAALRPLAEAWQSMGDSPAALEVYRKAVEAGVENPNSRPRAEDLSATCCSMALHGVEPDAALWARIGEIARGLGHPW